MVVLDDGKIRSERLFLSFKRLGSRLNNGTSSDVD